MRARDFSALPTKLSLSRALLSGLPARQREITRENLEPAVEAVYAASKAAGAGEAAADGSLSVRLDEARPPSASAENWSDTFFAGLAWPSACCRFGLCRLLCPMPPLRTSRGQKPFNARPRGGVIERVLHARAESRFGVQADVQNCSLCLVRLF